ncbi:MAG: hypothetical protein SPI18_02185, partial [Prevotella sp.]|nr:hypothetical protein [Prevotella sp.]
RKTGKNPLIIWPLAKLSLPLRPHPNQRILKILERHNKSRHLSLYNKGICEAQEKAVFPVNLLADHLAIPNNLLLSLPLSLLA